MTASLAGVFVAASLFASSVSAAEVTVIAGVRVATPACPIAPVSVPAFVDSLRVELAGRARAPGGTLVTLAIEPCDAATARVHVEVTIDARPAGESDVGLDDIAVEARPRALALAVAELVRAQPNSAPPLPSAATTPPPPTVPARPTAGFSADALFELLPNRDTRLWGGRLTASIDDARWSRRPFRRDARLRARPRALMFRPRGAARGGSRRGLDVHRGRRGLRPSFRRFDRGFARAAPAARARCDHRWNGAPWVFSRARAIGRAIRPGR